MEEKIYERQVLKQSLAQRVIDEHQIERHFTSADLRELYTFKPNVLDPENKQPTPKLPSVSCLIFISLHALNYKPMFMKRSNA